MPTVIDSTWLLFGISAAALIVMLVVIIMLAFVLGYSMRIIREATSRLIHGG
jgi:hypothetical protein